MTSTPDPVVPDPAGDPPDDPTQPDIADAGVAPEPAGESHPMPEPEQLQPAPEPRPEPEPTPEPEPEPTVLDAADLMATVAAVKEAVRLGECVVIPTDTVYGIGADAFSPVAVQKLLDAKQRGRDMPPPVLIADGLLLDALASDIPEPARALAAAHWPGPLTLILKAHSSLRMDLGETDGTIAVRVPDHEVARAILRATGPLAVSSANVSGREPATRAEEAVAQLRSSVAAYVDGGPTPGSVPSTIVDFSGAPEGRIVRTGVLSYADLLVSAPALTDGTPAREPEPEATPHPEPETVPQGGPAAQPTDPGDGADPAPAALAPARVDEAVEGSPAPGPETDIGGPADHPTTS